MRKLAKTHTFTGIFEKFIFSTVSGPWRSNDTLPWRHSGSFLGRGEMTVYVCTRLWDRRFRQRRSPNSALFLWSKWNYFSGLHQKGITNADDVCLSKRPSWCTVILNWLRVYEPALGVSHWSELYKDIIILMLLKINSYDCAFFFFSFFFFSLPVHLRRLNSHIPTMICCFKSCHILSTADTLKPETLWTLINSFVKY